MKVIESPGDIREEVGRLRSAGARVGLVPTMGYLHEGHASLVRGAAVACDLVVVSIFVNPIQFGPNEDFERYPRDMARDLEICREAGAGLIYAPTVEKMYPTGFQTGVSVGRLSRPLCGAMRPGHFDGVATVVAKLLNAVRPDMAFFGEKDFQQLLVIRRMARDLDMGVEIVGMPIVREADGLAMSSRNVYLSIAERERALCLSRSLATARSLFAGGEKDAALLLKGVAEVLKEAGVTPEYAELRDVETLEEVGRVEGPTLLALAARLGATRLIDNTVLGR